MAVDIERERTTLFQWLTWTVEHEATVSQDYGESTGNVHASLQSAWRRISPEELGTIIEPTPDRGNTHHHRSWVYLPAPSRGTMRAFLVNTIWDFTGEVPRNSFQVAGFWFCEDELRASAWRFEGPEQSQPETLSHHGYHHAQPCTHLLRLNSDFHREQVPLIYTPASVGVDDSPTFPLDAASCTDLIVCLMVALYGRREAARLLQGANIPALVDRLTKLRTMVPPAI